MAKNNKKPLGICNLFPIIFFGAIFLFSWLQIKPALIGYWQDTVFLTGKDFFMQFVKYPGGIINYVSDFIAQFYIYSWLGAILIGVVSVIICLLTLYLFRVTGLKTDRTFLYLIPAFLIIFFVSDYNFHIDIIIGILTALLGFILFVKIPDSLIKLFVFIISAVIIYYVSGGSLFFYSFLCLFYILLSKKYTNKIKFTGLFIILLFSVLLPLIAIKNVQGLTVKNAFLNTLPKADDFKTPLLPYMLHLFFVIILFIPRISKTAIFKKLGKKASKEFKCKVQLYLILALTVLVFLSANIKNDKELINIEYLARNGKWKKLIDESNRLQKVGFPFIYHINRALAHNEMLLDNMFYYPQRFGTDGIFISSEFAYEKPMLNSDFYYEIGHVNESLHWAYEALSIKGPAPDILKRLVIGNILKEEYQAALKYLRNLEKTLFYKKWALSYMETITGNSDLSSLHQFAKIKNNMPDKDFIFYSEHTPLELAVLLEKNPENLMAFQYLVAYKLLNADLSDLPLFINNFMALDYKSLPRHFEEALILFMIHSGDTDKFKWGPYIISEETLNRFNEYDRILKAFNNNPQAAKDAIHKSSLRNTFWYYAMYIYPNITKK